MSGAAIIGSAAIGAGASYMAGSKASKSASKATDASAYAAELQYETSMEQLEFAKQQYADWEGIFGPIQQNLSQYYQHLSPDTYSALGIQNIEKQYAQSRQNLDQELAKRGITNSGATVAGLTQLEQARMLGNAEVRTNAPQMVASAKQGFLNAGLGVQSNVQSGISNAYSNQMSILGQQSSNSLQQSNLYATQAAQGYAGIGSSVGAGINSYMMYNALNPSSSVLANAGGAGSWTTQSGQWVGV